MAQNQKSEELAFVCIHIFDNSRPVLLVTRNNDELCFLCGDMHEDDPQNFRVVGANHIYERDQSVFEAAQLLNDNCEAERESVDEKWQFTT
jgi:hypothetical protein